jgi:hypothetical protein
MDTNETIETKLGHFGDEAKEFIKRLVQDIKDVLGPDDDDEVDNVVAGTTDRHLAAQTPQVETPAENPQPEESAEGTPQPNAPEDPVQPPTHDPVQPPTQDPAASQPEPQTGEGQETPQA